MPVQLILWTIAVILFVVAILVPTRNGQFLAAGLAFGFAGFAVGGVTT
jgi:hypothetical protein